MQPNKTETNFQHNFILKNFLLTKTFPICALYVEFGIFNTQKINITSTRTVKLWELGKVLDF